MSRNDVESKLSCWKQFKRELIRKGIKLQTDSENESEGLEQPESEACVEVKRFEPKKFEGNRIVLEHRSPQSQNILRKKLENDHLCWDLQRKDVAQIANHMIDEDVQRPENGEKSLTERCSEFNRDKVHFQKLVNAGIQKVNAQWKQTEVQQIKIKEQRNELDREKMIVQNMKAQLDATRKLLKAEKHNLQNERLKFECQRRKQMDGETKRLIHLVQELKRKHDEMKCESHKLNVERKQIEEKLMHLKTEEIIMNAERKDAIQAEIYVKEHKHKLDELLDLKSKQKEMKCKSHKLNVERKQIAEQVRATHQIKRAEERTGSGKNCSTKHECPVGCNVEIATCGKVRSRK